MTNNTPPRRRLSPTEILMQALSEKGYGRAPCSGPWRRDTAGAAVPLSAAAVQEFTQLLDQLAAHARLAPAISPTGQKRRTQQLEADIALLRQWAARLTAPAREV